MSDYADKNELYHWLKGKEKPGHKYTSRYMKNGKWRYVYGAAKNLGDRVKDWWGVDERERLAKAGWAYEAAKRNGEMTPRRLRKTTYADIDYKNDKPTGKVGRYVNEGPDLSGTHWTRKSRTDSTMVPADNIRWDVQDNYDPGQYSKKNLNAKRNAYERAKTAYYKTPMGKLEKAGEKVSKAMSKASGWIKKKSSSVKKKLSELSGGKEKLAKANQATGSYAFNRFAIANNKKNRDKYKDYNPKTNKYRDTHDPTDFDRQYLNAKRNAYQRSQDAYNKSLRGRINNAFTTKKKKKNK